jgi:hypothetical protein
VAFVSSLPLTISDVFLSRFKRKKAIPFSEQFTSELIGRNVRKTRKQMPIAVGCSYENKPA